MTRAYAYLRVSGKGQVKGDGFPRQLQAIKTYAAEHDLKAVQVFREEGVAGNKESMDRPAWAAMMTALLGNGVKTVIIEKLDRLARDLMVQEATIAHLAKNGIMLISAVQVLTAERQGLSAVAVGEESEVPNLDETGGEDMEKETPDEFHGIERHDLEAFAVLRVPPSEADTISCEAHQAAVGDGHAVGIASQVFEHMLGALQGRFGVDDPLGLTELSEPGMKWRGVGERPQLPAELQLALGESASQTG